MALLPKAFLDRLAKGLTTASERMTLEEFRANISLYSDHKHDGDWISRIEHAKSALISLDGFPAFNKIANEFRFFAERAETRPHHREQALRGAYFTAALACVALDRALERLVYRAHDDRQLFIDRGVAYGDTGDARVQRSIRNVLDVISEAMDDGRSIARRAESALDEMFANVRAEMIAEFFTKESNASILFPVARELEERAHRSAAPEIQRLTVEAKSVLGVFADFVKAKRPVLYGEDDLQERSASPCEENDVQPGNGEDEQEKMF